MSTDDFYTYTGGALDHMEPAERDPRAETCPCMHHYGLDPITTCYDPAVTASNIRALGH